MSVVSLNWTGGAARRSEWANLRADVLYDLERHIDKVRSNKKGCTERGTAANTCHGRDTTFSSPASIDLQSIIYGQHDLLNDGGRMHLTTMTLSLPPSSLFPPPLSSPAPAHHLPTCPPASTILTTAATIVITSLAIDST